ncbi:hypothetical protein IE53DRAFT_166581 [Violaceomyces palustris]|uniref:Uncharacterized protein n=1 Tax=Violaceomyces palustris TaxID=1673888 RepID=A0ACD0NT97_9BASI|nr:hypothetical protein IE53DRAFT_166581 [Violaceomyces palustris]
MASTSDQGLLLHPDALHCLKRKQLVSLCTRLDVKASGKNAELIARLQQLASTSITAATATATGITEPIASHSESSELLDQSPKEEMDDDDDQLVQPVQTGQDDSVQVGQDYQIRQPPETPFRRVTRSCSRTVAATTPLHHQLASQEPEVPSTLRRSARVSRNLYQGVVQSSSSGIKPETHPAPLFTTQMSEERIDEASSDMEIDTSIAATLDSAAERVDQALEEAIQQVKAENVQSPTQGTRPLRLRTPEPSLVLAEFGSIAQMEKVNALGQIKPDPTHASASALDPPQPCTANASLKSQASHAGTVESSNSSSSSSSSPWRHLGGTLKGIKQGLQRMGSLSPRKEKGVRATSKLKRSREDDDDDDDDDDDHKIDDDPASRETVLQELKIEPYGTTSPSVTIKAEPETSFTKDGPIAGPDGETSLNRMTCSSTQPLRIIKPRPSRARAKENGLPVCLPTSRLYPDLSKIQAIDAFSEDEPGSAVQDADHVPGSLPLEQSLSSINTSTNCVSSSQFSAAASSILAEMNARLAASGKATASLPAPGTWTSFSSRTSLRDLAKGGASTRFDGEHEKQFGKMDSIANHYAAKRAQTTSRVGAVDGVKSSMSVSSRRVDLASKQGQQNAAKRIKTASFGVPASPGKAVSRPPVAACSKSLTEAEREANRRRLALARHRRLSKGNTSSSLAAQAKAKGRAKGRLGRFTSGLKGMLSGGGSSTKATVAKPTAGSGVNAASPRKVDQGSVGSSRTSASGGASSSSPSSKSFTGVLKKKSIFDLKASISRKPDKVAKAKEPGDEGSKARATMMTGQSSNGKAGIGGSSAERASMAARLRGDGWVTGKGGDNPVTKSTSTPSAVPPAPYTTSAAAHVVPKDSARVNPSSKAVPNRDLMSGVTQGQTAPTKPPPAPAMLPFSSTSRTLGSAKTATSSSSLIWPDSPSKAKAVSEASFGRSLIKKAHLSPAERLRKRKEEARIAHQTRIGRSASNLSISASMRSIQIAPTTSVSDSSNGPCGPVKEVDDDKGSDARTPSTVKAPPFLAVGQEKGTSLLPSPSTTSIRASSSKVGPRSTQTSSTAARKNAEIQKAAKAGQMKRRRRMTTTMKAKLEAEQEYPRPTNSMRKVTAVRSKATGGDENQSPSKSSLEQAAAIRAGGKVKIQRSFRTNDKDNNKLAQSTDLKIDEDLPLKVATHSSGGGGGRDGGGSVPPTTPRSSRVFGKSKLVQVGVVNPSYPPSSPTRRVKVETRLESAGRGQGGLKKLQVCETLVEPQPKLF